MIYATGDCHGNFQRFKPHIFTEQKAMSRDDLVVICGDVGGVWFGDTRDDDQLDWLEALPFTTVFVSGNHENFDALARYPIQEWNGGKVQFIRPHVIHLLRGQVFTLQGRTFFTMGGASSHDIADGILEPDDPCFERKYKIMRSQGKQFRINHMTWWKEELPTEEEYAEARRNLDACGWEVDYIITHAAPNSIMDQVVKEDIQHDELTDFLEEVKQKARYHYWLFGHHHDNKAVDDKHILLWEQIVRVL
jgi:hypothetical protein